MNRRFETTTRNQKRNQCETNTCKQAKRTHAVLWIREPLASGISEHPTRLSAICESEVVVNCLSLCNKTRSGERAKLNPAPAFIANVYTHGIPPNFGMLEVRHGEGRWLDFGQITIHTHENRARSRTKREKKERRKKN